MNIYDNVAVGVSLNPQAISGSSAVNGSGVDTKNYRDAMAVIRTGATSGAPDSFSIAGKVQDSADNSSFADVTGLTFTAITAVSTTGLLRLNLMGDQRRYLRIVVTPTFSGGTSPSVELFGVILLGNAVFNPVNS